MYRHCLSRQVNEMELLKSFFCNEGELEIVKEEQYEQIKSTLETSKGINTEELPSFCVNVSLSVFSRKECTITMSISFPPFYPSTETLSVDFYGASKIFTREQEQQLRQEISNFAQTKLGQECVLDVIQFTKEWLELTFTAPVASSPSSPVSDLSPCSSEADLVEENHSGEHGSKQEKQRLHDFRRVLLWFATIAPDRAKALADWAKQLGLTGLSKLGTPALLVVEGAKLDVDEFISSLRTYRWKKMDILWEECCRVPDVNSFRKFQHFDECMVSIPDLQPIFRNAGLEEVFKEGLKMHGYFSSNLKVF